ncbi:jg17861, partial [Pararge aegeria aegeria]
WSLAKWKERDLEDVARFFGRLVGLVEGVTTLGNEEHDVERETLATAEASTRPDRRKF